MIVIDVCTRCVLIARVMTKITFVLDQAVQAVSFIPLFTLAFVGAMIVGTNGERVAFPAFLGEERRR